MIVVCGEALVDVVDNGDGTHRATPGGGPFNTARALARLGVPVAFLGRLSSDPRGRELAALLRSDGVSLELVTVGPEPTTTAFARLGGEGTAEYEFTVEGTSAPQLTSAMVPAAWSDEVDALHVGSLGLVLEPMATTVFELVRREHGRRAVVLDPNVRLGLGGEEVYRERVLSLARMSTIVKASESDLAWLYPGLPAAAGAEALAAAGVPLAVVTLGAAGAYAVHRDLRLHVDASQVEVVDTIGAGDAFGAGLLAWLRHHGALRRLLRLDRADLRAALEYASWAAALTCTRAGAQPPTRAEIASAAEGARRRGTA